MPSVRGLLCVLRAPTDGTAPGRFFAAPNGAAWSDTALRVQPSSAWTEQLTGAKFAANASGAIALGDLFAAEGLVIGWQFRA